MALLDRLKGILLDPRTEWPKIAAEPATVQSIYTGWVMIFAAIGPLAVLIVGDGGAGAKFAIGAYIMALIITFMLALIVDALSSAFGGSKDFVSALKLVAYSSTVVWIAEIASFVVPLLGVLVLLAAAIYACYTFLVGATVLKKCDSDKAIPYTLVVLLCAIVLPYIVRLAVVGIAFSAMTGVSAARLLH